MKNHAISKSTFCAGTSFNPNTDIFEVSIRIITNSVYINLAFEKKETPEISINRWYKYDYNNSTLENIITFKKFKELFYQLSGELFDINIDSWADFDYS